MNELEKLNAVKVFEKIGNQLRSEKSQSLWRSVQSEIEKRGIRSAVSWLESALKQKSEGVRKELNKFREEEV